GPPFPLPLDEHLEDVPHSAGQDQLPDGPVPPRHFAEGIGILVILKVIQYAGTDQPIPLGGAEGRLLSRLLAPWPERFKVDVAGEILLAGGPVGVRVHPMSGKTAQGSLGAGGT